MWPQTGDERQWLAIEHRRIQDLARRKPGSAKPRIAISIGLPAVAKYLLEQLGRSIQPAQRAGGRARPSAR